MERKNKKLKLNIKGKFKKFWSGYLLRNKVKALGLNLHSVEHPSSEHVRLTLSGEIKQLWKVINWTQNCALFFTTSDLLIEFVE